MTENIFGNMDWEDFGIIVNLNHLRFAHDIVIFVERPDILQTMLQQLHNERSKADLSI